MFSIRNLRSRHKLKPPRVLLCSLLCLLTLSMILLIAQLRAIEINTPNQALDIKQQIELTNIFKKEQPVSIETNRIETRPTWPQLDLIDRDDRDPLAVVATSGLDPANVILDNQLATLTERASAIANESAVNNVTDSVSTESLDGLSTRATVAQTALPLTTSSVSSPEVGEDQMMQQAAAELIASFGQKPDQLNESIQTLQLQPSRLAELTAAGTAAGLLMHDLIAQANMVDQTPYGAGSESILDSNAEGDNESGEKANDAPGGSEEQMLARQDHNQPASDEEDEDDIADRQQDRKRPMAITREDLLGANQMYPRNGAPLQAHQTANQRATLESDAPPDPPDENQTPDSIESLMGADLGSDIDEPEEGISGPQSGEQSSADETDHQQPADTHLYAQNNNVPGVTLSQIQQQQQQQQQPVGSQDGADQEDDTDYNEDSDDGRQQSNALDINPDLQSATGQIERRHYGIPTQSMSAPEFRTQPIMVGNGLRLDENAIGPPVLEHNLVAPMRDTLVDLNAAAGHYYGKKKKKMVKKVKKKKKVIIKKKKKIKYKKYKVIKIKKKKKKKGKKKYHHHPHKGHHHGGHGKYYMYAKVPKKKAWEFGFKKGNKKHWISRHEKGYKNKFKTKVKWYDSKSKGKGVHIWDYNHHDKKKKKHY